MPGERALLEVERKFDVPDDAVVPPLGGLPYAAAAGQPVAAVLRATYFDTADLALLRAGITLRHRSGGSDAGWHLKLPTLVGRFEIQEPDTGANVPERLRSITRGVARGVDLTPVATIETARATTPLLGPGQELLAEVCDDRVTGTDLRSGSRQSWREWEVELKAGGGNLADAAASALIRAGAVPSPSPSKLARTLGHPHAATPAAASPLDDSPRRLRDVLGAYLGDQSEQIHRLDPMVRADLPDAVHKMRVACRRLRSVLAAYGHAFDPGSTDRLRDDLAWTGAELGLPRDLEVQVATLSSVIEDEELRTAVESAMAPTRSAAHTEAVAAMESDRYLAMLEDLVDLAESPPWSGDADRKAAKAMAEVIEQRVRVVRRRADRASATTEEQAEEQADEPAEELAHATALHEVRKAAKRARYAAEAATPALGGFAEGLADRLADLQSELGAHHDTVVARADIPRLAQACPGLDASATDDALRALGRLHEQAAERLLGEVLAFAQQGTSG